MSDFREDVREKSGKAGNERGGERPVLLYCYISTIVVNGKRGNVCDMVMSKSMTPFMD